MNPDELSALWSSPADGEAPHEIALSIERVMDTTGWISANFHVHAIASGDSSLSVRGRLASFRAQDVNAIVASDHWVNSDYEADLGSHAPEPHTELLGRAFTNLRVLAFTNPLLVDLEGDSTLWDRQPGRGRSAVR